MDYFRLTSTGADASVLAFGCASIMGFHARRESLRAMQAAREHGITVFDVARSYGYGQAEAVVGRFLGSQRTQVVIISKFGILPDPSMRANAIRMLRGGIGGLRHVTLDQRRGADSIDAFSPHWSPDMMRASLHRSLRELHTDYLDVFLLHSPPATITKRTDLFEALDRLQTQGLIRSYGLSTDARQASQALASARHAIGVVQHPYCPLTGTTDVVATPPPAVLLNHIFGGRGGPQTTARLVATLAASEGLQDSTRGKLRSAPAAAILGDIMINGALRAARAQGAVVSMLNPEHIARNCAVAGHSLFSGAELGDLLAALGRSAVSHRHALPIEPRVQNDQGP